LEIEEVEKATLVDWNEIYEKIDKAFLIVEANSKIVEKFAKKIEKGMKTVEIMNRRYSILSIVKCLLVAKIINPVGQTEINYICRYLKEHKEISDKLGFQSELIKSNMFRAVRKKIESRGLTEEFLEIVEKISKGKENNV